MFNRLISIVVTAFYLVAAAEHSSINSDLLTSVAPFPCSSDDASSCKVDGYLGSSIIFEDATTRIWNFTLGSGEMTSMHRHNCGYHFVALTSSELEVWGEDGKHLMNVDLKAGDVVGFAIDGDDLVQTATTNPLRLPRTHAAKNIGLNSYDEIIYESKLTCAMNAFSREL